MNPHEAINGKTFTVVIGVKNVTNNSIMVDVNSVLNSHFYTGKKHKLIAQDVKKDQFIQANSGISIFCVFSCCSMKNEDFF